MLGTDELYRYLDTYELILDENFDDIMYEYEKKPWAHFVSADNRHLISDSALSFLDGLLR